MITRAFACAVCGRIIRGKHTNAITCSGACRVRLCRHPEVRERLVAAAAAAHVPPAELLERKALKHAHPDLFARVETGNMAMVGARKLACLRVRFAGVKEPWSVTTGTALGAIAL